MDLAALEPRLENWARAQRSGGSSGARIASAEGMYRRPGVLYRDEATATPDVDTADAYRVNEAWKRLMSVDRDVLRMHYVWGAHSSFICRRLRIPQGGRNPHAWDFALYHAHKAIASKLEKYEDLAKPIRYAYNRAQMTESVD